MNGMSRNVLLLALTVALGFSAGCDDRRPSTKTPKKTTAKKPTGGNDGKDVGAAKGSAKDKAKHQPDSASSQKQDDAKKPPDRGPKPPAVGERGKAANDQKHVEPKADAPKTGEYASCTAFAGEVEQALQSRPTLVVWLVDRSPSAVGLRRRMAEALHLAYLRMNAAAEKYGKDATSPRLVSAVVGFGERPEFLLRAPTPDSSAVLRAIAESGVDPSTHEATFAAIEAAADEFTKPETRQSRYILFAVLTDESGDDDANVDRVAERLTKLSTPVFVIGPPAPFSGVWPDARFSEGGQPGNGATGPEPTAIRQGPAARQDEHVEIAFASTAAQNDFVDSGFGPFALEMICRKTGGRYLAIRTKDDSGDYLDSMGTRIATPNLREVYRYAPDYVSEAKYKELLAENRARAALCEAAKMAAVETLRTPRMEFGARDAARLNADLSMAQREAAKLSPEVNRIYDALAAGQPDRAKLTGVRWQVAYDLAFGRAMAAKARVDGYNAMLALLKQGKKFQNPNSSRWVLVQADATGADSTIDKMIDRARKMLRKIVEEHPRTPWAWEASRELEASHGWKWTER